MLLQAPQSLYEEDRPNWAFLVSQDFVRSVGKRGTDFMLRRDGGSSTGSVKKMARDTGLPPIDSDRPFTPPRLPTKSDAAISPIKLSIE
jgi:hypothetical protein